MSDEALRASIRFSLAASFMKGNVFAVDALIDAVISHRAEAAAEERRKVVAYLKEFRDDVVSDPAYNAVDEVYSGVLAGEHLEGQDDD